jgi:hypothetical protein
MRPGGENNNETKSTINISHLRFLLGSNGGAGNGGKEHFPAL